MDNVREAEHQLDAITLTPDCIGDDVAQALENLLSLILKILDDFCINASNEGMGQHMKCTRQEKIDLKDQKLQLKEVEQESAAI